MKRFIILFGVFLLLLGKDSWGQESITTYFETNKDTIKCEIGKEYEYEFKVFIPPVPKELHGSKVTFKLLDSDYQIAKENILFPSSIVTIADSSKIIEKKFKIKMKTTTKENKLVMFELVAHSDSGSLLKVKGNKNIKKIYINPIKVEEKMKGYEFWVFTGTNFDFLDGAKLKDLYFKGEYLVRVVNNKKFSRSWTYITFGRNRFFSDVDSLYDVRFTDIVQSKSKNDSLVVAEGIYNVKRQIITNNAFATVDYLHHINQLSTKGSHFFLTGGVSFEIQTIKTTFSDINIQYADTIVDTTKKLLTNPPAKDFIVQQFNSNFGIGLFHILNTEDINIKTQVNLGLSIIRYPFRVRDNGQSSAALYTSEDKFFLRARLDATIVKPQIAFGVEFFLRQSQIPLFSVTLTKVWDVKKLGELFDENSSIFGKSMVGSKLRKYN